MNKGIIAINKPKDWTSFDVVNKIKHMVKPDKVGHLGTLDPMATGVLLVTVGKATKLFDIMQEKQKTYLATFEFGYETDTLDATGKLIKSATNLPTREEIEQILPKFIGEIDQIPPLYSAKSINGIRAYDLARQGIEFELKSKRVQITNIELVEYSNNKLVLQISCGSGTYIRSIGRDIAYKLNTCATMISLVRTKIDQFSVEECYEIENISKENINDFILPLDKILDYEVLSLTDEEVFKILNGQTININKNNGNYFLKSKNEIVAIAKIDNFKAKMLIYLAWFIVNY